MKKILPLILVSIIMFNGDPTAYAATTQIDTSSSWISSMVSPGVYTHVRDGDITKISAEEYINRYRALLNLSPLSINTTLQQAATDHTKYLQVNGANPNDAHAQTATNAGFTGETPNERCTYRGYAEYCTEVQAGTSGNGDLYSGIDAWMMTPFHRLTLIDPGVTEIGCAQNGGWIVCDVGLDLDTYATKKTTANNMHYPANGQVISTTFYVSENPMPYPEYAYQFIGPTLMFWPLSTSGTPEAAVSLYDLTKNTSIETLIYIDTANENANGAIFFNPVEPLELNHEYAVHVYDVSGENLYDTLWTFKTQKSDNIDFPNGDQIITYDAHVAWADPSGSEVLVTTPNTSVKTTIDELAGKIMLAVDYHGEAWYIDPLSRLRYYLPDGETAYTFLRLFGLGITNADLAKIPTENDSQGGGDLAKALAGRILLQVEEHGEAWYVNPSDLKRYYMKNGEEAYRIMRELSLGTYLAWISQIPVGTLN